MVFAQRLRRLRQARGLTQRQLAAAFGFAPSTIAMYESGRRTPDLETLTRLAEYFTVSLDYLVRESGPAPPEPLPPDIREFVAREANRPYLDLARELAEEGIRPDEVRELSRFIRRLSRKR